MMKLTAYMDETGHAQDLAQKFVGMAGLIAPADKWSQFESGWHRVLGDFNLPYFHMIEFAHSVKIFVPFKNDEPRRKELFGRLIEVIEAANPLPMGWILPLDVYRNLSPQEQNVFGEPYYRALLYCLFLPAPLYVATQSYEEIEQERIKLVFSEQIEFGPKALRYYETARSMYPIFQRVDPPTFCDMKKLVPLQAADIVAYELNREYERQLFRPQDKPRFGYQRLLAIANKALAPRGVGEKIPFAFLTDDDVKELVKA
jgi:hypothetical protein